MKYKVLRETNQLCEISDVHFLNASMVQIISCLVQGPTGGLNIDYLFLVLHLSGSESEQLMSVCPEDIMQLG